MSHLIYCKYAWDRGTDLPTQRSLVYLLPGVESGGREASIYIPRQKAKGMLWEKIATEEIIPNSLHNKYNGSIFSQEEGKHIFQLCISPAVLQSILFISNFCFSFTPLFLLSEPLFFVTLLLKHHSLYSWNLCRTLSCSPWQQCVLLQQKQTVFPFHVFPVYQGI